MMNLQRLMGLGASVFLIQAAAPLANAAPPAREKPGVRARGTKKVGESQRAGKRKVDLAQEGLALAKARKAASAARAKAKFAAAKLKLAPAALKQAVALERKLSVKQKAGLRRLAQQLRAAARAHAAQKKDAFGAALQKEMLPAARELAVEDPVLLTSAILRQATADAEADVNALATTISQNNATRQLLREQIVMLRDLLSDWDDDLAKKEVTWREVDGSEHTRPMTKDEVQDLIATFEDMLSTLGNMGQLDMLKLQDAMNAQAQLMQMMSNIQKMMNDTAMAIVRNLK